MQSKSQPVLNMGPESDYTSEKKRFMQALTGIMHGQTIMVVSKGEEGPCIIQQQRPSSSWRLSQRFFSVWLL